MLRDKIIKAMLALVCAIALGASLAACSGGSTSTVASKADPATEIVGNWKLAAIDYQGLIAVGNFEEGDLAELVNFSLTVDKDGTGSFTNTDSTTGEKESKTFKWTAKGDGIDLTWDDSEVAENAVLAYNTQDNVIEVSLSESAATSDLANIAGKMYFTKDGKYKDYKPIDVSATQPITDDKNLVGTWKISGLGLLGMTMFGTTDQIEQALGSASTSMVLNADGTGSFDSDDSSEKCTWSTSGSGTTVNLDLLGTSVSCPVTAYDNGIILDMSSLMGSEIYFMFEKQSA